MDKKDVINTLKKHGLKVTPQRVAVLGAVLTMKNHPTVDNIVGYIKTNDPNIATGTVYKTLDTFIEKGLIKRVKTDSDIMRYDAAGDRHHHLYCIESDRIEDFYDDDLDAILDEYLKMKNIPNFKIQDIKLQITGKFTDNMKEK
jgi:Fur family transcriptional regulator, peroxide stress response regulator